MKPIPFHSLPAAILICIAAATVSADILGTLALGLSPKLAILSLIIGATFALLLIKTEAESPEPNPETPHRKTLTNKILLFVFALVAFRSFCWLIFENNGSIRVSATNNFGDLPWHLSLIHTFANQLPLWPESPNFTGLKLHYPAGIDLFSAVTILAGVPLYSSLTATGLVLSAITALTLDKWGKSFALAAFLFNGGIAGFEFFRTWTPTDFQNPLAWKNIVLSLLIPQRGFLYAFPLGLLLLSHWKTTILKKTPLNTPTRPSLPFWAETTLYCTLPLFHAHTFLFLSLLLGFWTLTAPNKKHALKLLLISLLPATCFTAQTTGILQPQSINPNLIHLQIGWMQKGHPFFEFWFTNFGILPLLVISFFFKQFADSFSKRNKSADNTTVLLFTLPALLIYILCLIISFAPWDWDNTKLMVWSYLIIMPFLWTHMISKWNPLLKVTTCIALFTSGATTLYSGAILPHNIEIAKITEYYSVKKASSNLKPGSVYVTYPAHNQPLALAGQRIACGFSGHIWSHGVDPTHQIAQVNAVMNGERDWLQRFEQLGATYLYWGSMEQQNYPNSTKPWEGNYPVVAAGPWGKIYQIMP